MPVHRTIDRTMPPPASPPLKIALLGFSDFERSALGSCFRLAGTRSPAYRQVHMLTDADYLLADADHLPSVQLVVATERLAETVFIGAQPPAGASAWMRRPIDPVHVLRELDALVLMGGSFSDDAGPRGDEDRASVLPATAPAAATLPTAAPPLVVASTQASAAAKAQPGAAARPHQSTAPRSPLMQASAPAPGPAAPRALLVDDSEVALRFLETRLKPWGLQTDRAATSEHALELLARRSYDYVFLDIELGAASEIDGLALCQLIKRTPSAVNAMVVVLSAHHSELDRVRGALAGCDAYLGKPLEALELARLLQRQGLKAPAAEVAQTGTRPG